MFARKKQQMSNAMTTYDGNVSAYSSSKNEMGSSLLLSNGKGNSYSGATKGNGLMYADLKSAHTQSIIDVNEEEFMRNRQQYANVEEYARMRDMELHKTAIPTKDESMRILQKQEEEEGEIARALAFQYAQQAEQVKQNTSSFWGTIKSLTNW